MLEAKNRARTGVVGIEVAEQPVAAPVAVVPQRLLPNPPELRMSHDPDV